MYHVLIHGSDEREYRLLRSVLPDNIKLNRVCDRSRLVGMAEDGIHGIVLRFSDPDFSDLAFVKRLSDAAGFAGVIVVVSNITPAQAVSCMRNGAYDCLIGPANSEILCSRLIRMMENAGSRELGVEPLISGSSEAVVSLRRHLALLAKESSHPVLITGETGSGKELAARTIHLTSGRRDGPFIAVNCAAYSDDLLGSELFGSYRGAFTGSTDRPGFFECSNGGTLFLDEIGEMSLRGQCGLLRILEEGTVRRMGSVKTKPVDVRIIAATNRRIEASVRSGCFRRDLFYRLGQLTVNVPPLRKRREDIPCLVRENLAGIDPTCRWRIEPGAMAKLIRHTWPGNVRELQSVVLNASLQADGGVVRSKNIVLRR